jgi:hypothetical protein
LEPSGFSAERILTEVLGAESVVSIDNSDYEGALETWDLNEPIPSRLANQFDTVLDFGTLEHVLDARCAITNVYNLCRDDAMILHASPTNGWVGHGFYQFSPVFFSSFYARVPTRLLEQSIVEFDVSPFMPGPFRGRSLPLARLTENQRHEFMSPNRSELHTLVLTGKKTTPPCSWGQPDYEEIWKLSEQNAAQAELVPRSLTSATGVRQKLNQILSASLERAWFLRHVYHFSGLVRIKVAIANQKRGLTRSNQSFKTE